MFQGRQRAQSALTRIYPDPDLCHWNDAASSRPDEPKDRCREVAARPTQAGGLRESSWIRTTETNFALQPVAGTRTSKMEDADPCFPAAGIIHAGSGRTRCPHSPPDGMATPQVHQLLINTLTHEHNCVLQYDSEHQALISWLWCVSSQTLQTSTWT